MKAAVLADLEPKLTALVSQAIEGAVQRALDGAQAGIRTEGENVAKAMTSALVVLATLIVNSSDRLSKRSFIFACRGAAVRLRTQREVLAARLIEMMCENVEKL